MCWTRNKSLTRMYCALGLLLILQANVQADDLVVSTDKGQIRGFLQTLPDDKKVQTFLGVPFAAPPVGDLRFRPPVQIDPWDGILNTTDQPNSCVQNMDLTFGNFSGSTMWNANTDVSEDCLFLNVWAPQTPTQKKPVMVWIFGGGFYSGSATLDIYDATYLAAETDVIVVSMQYRVGPLGFLAMDTPEAPGNAGLMDQRMALEWVNRNIHLFGGDPQSVTLMGESAGAVSVGLFLICDLCRGYFHKAILQSGSPSAGWGVRPKEEIWNRSNKLAELVNCDKKDSPEEVIKCLRKVDAQKITDQEWLTIEGGFVQFPFVPIVDGTFIPDDPQKTIKAGRFKKIPILIGSNENESSFFLIYQDLNLFKLDDESPVSPKDFDRIMDQNTFKYFPTYPNKLSNLSQTAIKYHYRNWLKPDDAIENRKAIETAGSDAYFVCPVNEMANAYARHNMPVYYYWFKQRWSANPWPEWMGVLHADEIWFTFGHPMKREMNFTEGERDLSRKMMAYFANFARTGNPNADVQNPDWPKFTPSEQKYRILSVDAFSGGATTGQYPRTEHCVFWDQYLPKIMEESCRISEIEISWEDRFKSWKKRYIEGWNDQFDAFLDNYKKTGQSSFKGDP